MPRPAQLEPSYRYNAQEPLTPDRRRALTSALTPASQPQPSGPSFVTGEGHRARPNEPNEDADEIALP